MRRFLISSPAFTDTAELHFNGDGTLICIDVSKTNMTVAIVRIFKDKAPAHIDELENCFKGTHAKIVEADFEATFEMFWKAYNKKINRIRAEKIWNKLDIVKQVSALHGIRNYDKFLHNEQWRTKADPETYLRNEMWANEWK